MGLPDVLRARTIAVADHLAALSCLHRRRTFLPRIFDRTSWLGRPSQHTGRKADGFSFRCASAHGRLAL